MELITLTESALFEIVNLAQNGFDVDVTKAHDGENLIIAKDDTGLVRLFAIERSSR